MNAASPTLIPRALHPWAWWGWALGIAVAVSMTTNPLLLLIAIGVLTFVVISRRGSSPWARAFKLYLWLGAFIIIVRMVLHVLVGLKFGDHLLITLPAITLPSWAAGINLLGPIYLEGLLDAALQGLRLATMIAAIGAANSLANPKRMLRALPGALQEIGAAIVVSVSVAPQLADSVRRVQRARALRGDTSKGIRSIPRVALPVLQDTLDRSIMLASAMDSRGYGRRDATPRPQRLATGVLSFAGLIGACIGIYAVLTEGAQSTATDAAGGHWGRWVLIASLFVCGLGLWVGGRGNQRTAYRPDPWLWPEWGTLACGVIAAYCLIRTGEGDLGLGMPLQPLAVPALPLLPTIGLLIAALPGLFTPVPPRPVSRMITRGAAA